MNSSWWIEAGWKCYGCNFTIIGFLPMAVRHTSQCNALLCCMLVSWSRMSFCMQASLVCGTSLCTSTKNCNIMCIYQAQHKRNWYHSDGNERESHLYAMAIGHFETKWFLCINTSISYLSSPIVCTFESAEWWMLSIMTLSGSGILVRVDGQHFPTHMLLLLSLRRFPHSRNLLFSPPTLPIS